MRNVIYLFLFFGIVISCQQKPAPQGASIDLTGYQFDKVDGTDMDFAFRAANNGTMMAEGMVTGGVRNGMWIAYFEDNDSKIKTISNFVNGVMNGPHLEFNNRGQIEKKVTYLNNQIHGLYSEFKFGRPLKEYMYNNGVLEGISKEYSDRGKLIKQTSYKNGKLHGTIVQYDDEGNEVLKYEYKNGEKVSGGIVSQ